MHLFVELEQYQPFAITGSIFDIFASVNVMLKNHCLHFAFAVAIFYAPPVHVYSC